MAYGVHRAALACGSGRGSTNGALSWRRAADDEASIATHGQQQSRAAPIPCHIPKWQPNSLLPPCPRIACNADTLRTTCHTPALSNEHLNPTQISL